MDFPLPRTHSERFPWRTAAYVAGGIATVELILLVFAGGALIGRHDASGKTPATVARPAKASVVKHSTPARHAEAAPAAHAKAKAKSKPAVGPVAHLARGRVEVLVLNGNGRTGAASAAADRVRQKGYRIGGVANAKRHDYPQSIVLYRGGFEGEGRRLARDLGVRVVGPLDGMRKSDLHGAHVVYILGT
jgi:hypothetical protein